MIKKGKWTVPGSCPIHIPFEMFSDYVSLRLQGEVWRPQCHVIPPVEIQCRTLSSSQSFIFFIPSFIPFSHHILNLNLNRNKMGRKTQ